MKHSQLAKWVVFWRKSVHIWGYLSVSRSFVIFYIFKVFFPSEKKHLTVINLNSWESWSKVERITKEIGNSNFFPVVFGNNIINFDINLSWNRNTKAKELLVKGSNALVRLARYHGIYFFPLFFLKTVTKATSIPFFIFIQATNYIYTFSLCE